MRKSLCIFVLSLLIIGCSSVSEKGAKTMKLAKTAKFSEKTVTTYIVLDIAKQLKGLDNGSIVEYETEDVNYVETDIRSWCDLTGNKIISVEKGTGKRVYKIQKQSNVMEKKKMALVISSDGLLELISPLGFALASELSDIDVSIYFQGEGVNVLKKGYEPKMKGFVNSLFSGFAKDGLNNIGHIPPQEKIIQLKELGAKIYVCGPSMDNFKVLESELIFNDLTICEYFTFIKELKDSDYQIYQ